MRLTKPLAAAGAAAGAAVLANQILARRAERSHPPEGKFVTVDGVRLHYIEGGAGPAIVLLHGNGTMARDFVLSGVFDLLARDFRVIAFDRPGFGFSDRPRTRLWTVKAQAALLNNALRMLEIRHPIVVGHSWGTMVAIALALHDPSDVAGLVLLAGYYYPSFRSDVVMMSLPAIPGLGDILRYTVSPLLARLMAPAGTRKMFAPAEVAARFSSDFPLELAVRPSQIRASAADTALMIPGAESLAGHYLDLSIPIAIMAGPEDEIVNFEQQSGRLAAELPGSTLHAISGAGHMVHYTAPERVAAAVRDVAKAAFAAA